MSSCNLAEGDKGMKKRKVYYHEQLGTPFGFPLNIMKFNFLTHPVSLYYVSSDPSYVLRLSTHGPFTQYRPLSIVYFRIFIFRFHFKVFFNHKLT